MNALEDIEAICGTYLPQKPDPEELLRVLNLLHSNFQPYSLNILTNNYEKENSFCSCFNISMYMQLTYGQFVHCEPFPFQHSLLMQMVYITLFTLTIIFAVVGNFTVIWIVLCHKSMRSVTNVYLLNLAVADTSISIMNTGFSWSYNFYYIWKFGEVYCGVNNLMGITPICASVFTMIAMSIDRYFAIVYPLRKRPQRKSLVLSIVLIWTLALLAGLPSYFISKVEVNYFYDGKTVFEDTICLTDNWPDNYEFLAAHYNNVLITVEYLIPLFFLTIAYFRVGQVLRSSKSLGDVVHQKSIAAKRRAATMLALVVFIFMIVWLPYNAYFLLSNYLPVPDDKKTALYIYINVYWLGMSSTVFNPVIYYFMNKRFRVGFRYAFRWLPGVKSSKEEYIAVLSTNRPYQHTLQANTLIATATHV